MTFQPCRPATIKLLPYERAPFELRRFFGINVFLTQLPQKYRQLVRPCDEDKRMPQILCMTAENIRGRQTADAFVR